MLDTINKEDFYIALSHYALEYMSSCKDFEQAVHALLEKVALQYNLSHITVLENKSNLSYLSVTYEWCKEGVEPTLDHIVAHSDNFKNFFLDPQNTKPFITNEDCVYYPLFDGIKQILKNKDCNSIIALPLKLRDKCIGLITFESEEDKFTFTEEVKRSFFQLKSILESFYFMMRSYKETRDKLDQKLRYDSITGLFNYETFLKEVDNLLQNSKVEEKYKIIYVDFVDFKYFNEIYGYSAGDEVLRLFNQSIAATFDKNVLACRIFSDYFVIMENLGKDINEYKLTSAVNALSYVFADKVKAKYPEASLQIAAGITVFKKDNEGIKAHIDNANKARKQAKLELKRCIVYDGGIDHKLRRNFMISNIAEEALHQHEFYFELQPKYNLKEKMVIGAEALVRWKRPDGSIIYPNEFIPIFERNEFIVKLDLYIYCKVCDYLRKKLERCEQVVPISVNVSRVHLRNKKFVKQIVQLVDFYNVPHHLLEFEITESIFLEKAMIASNAIMNLRKEGFIVSMDDFGAGYSSLNLLKNEEFDILKLDKGFLDGGIIHKKEEIIIESIITMMKKMNIMVLCEGVETKEQAQLLELLQCDLVQGYYFGRPMEISQFERLLKKEEELLQS